MSLAVVLVHYRTPELLPEALEALRSDLVGLPLEIDWIVVDNGSDPGDAELLAAQPVRLLSPGRNLGFAGGVNLGARESAADRLLIANPDVVVQAGCVPALLEALDGGAATAGPRLYWDSRCRMLLPPLEPDGLGFELLRRVAGASERLVTRARRVWRRHARRHWSASTPIRSHSLSGGLLLVDRSAWERVGPFDDGYRLYFEERDWLRRLAAAGLAAVHVPGARALHWYARSALLEPRAERWYAESERRFLRRAYGRPLAAVLRMLSRSRGNPPWPSLLTGSGAEPPCIPERSGRARWVEVAAAPTGFPAAAERLSPEHRDGWRLPADVWQRLAPGRYVLQLVDEGGRDLGRWTVTRPVVD